MKSSNLKSSRESSHESSLNLFLYIHEILCKMMNILVYYNIAIKNGSKYIFSFFLFLILHNFHFFQMT
jgi:hypothetical protein